MDGAPCCRCQLENDPRKALRSQDHLHRFHLRTQPWLWKLVAQRPPKDHDYKLWLGGHARNRRRQLSDPSWNFDSYRSNQLAPYPGAKRPPKYVVFHPQETGEKVGDFTGLTW